MAEVKKMKRILCLVLVCLMLTPIISFATGANNTATTTPANNEQPDADDVAQTGTELTEEEKKVEAQMQKEALAAAHITTSKADIKGHSYLCENSRYELYLDEAVLSIIVRDKQTGAIMESVLSDAEAEATLLNSTTAGGKEIPAKMKSSIWVRYVAEGENVANQDTYIGKNEMETPEVKKNADGFEANVAFPDYGLELSMKVTLDEKGLHVEVPQSSIKETKNDQYLFGEIGLYSYLGYTKLGYRKGYMFVPDGCGALIPLENNNGKYKSGYTGIIYGSDISNFSLTESSETGTTNLYAGELNTINSPEHIIMPVYGMVHTDSGLAYLAVIESGEENAMIYAQPNLDANPCNFVTANFHYRDIINEKLNTTTDAGNLRPQEKLNTSDIKLTFLFASDEQASYAGLAVKYRELLTENGDLQKRSNEFKVRLDFLGADKENFLVFKSNVVMTTVDNIRDIIGELQDDGVTNIFGIYEGWQSGGVYDLPVTEYDVNRSIGGKSALKKLVKELNNEQTEFYLSANTQTINEDTNSLLFDSMEMLDKTTYRQVIPENKVYSAFKMEYPAKSISNLKSLVKSMKSSGLNTIALEGITDQLFSYREDKKQYTRKDSATIFEKGIAGIKENAKLALDQPFEYLWKYTDVYLNAPLSTSSYQYCTQEVPFLEIVLRGSIPMYSEYVNYEANKTEYFLKLVEVGTFPSFYITQESPSQLQNTDSNWNYSSEYATYKDTIEEYYKELKAIYDETKDSYIMDHQANYNGNEGITVVTYENGLKIYVNYNKKDKTIDGMIISAQNYKIVKAGEAQ